MKKLYVLFSLLLLSALPLLLAACSDEATPSNENQPAEDGIIRLHNAVGGFYFGNVWDEGTADYYFLLSNDTQFGQTEQGFDVPMTPGCWLLYIDLWGAVSEDHTRPIIPSGTYTWNDKSGPEGRTEFSLTSEYTLATLNQEKVGDQYRIVDYFFQNGTVVVELTLVGYRIDATFTTTDGEELHFVYEGPITLEDQSDDEPWEPGLKEDVTIEPVLATSYCYSANETYENHVLMLFDTENLSEDGMHVNEPGCKLHLDLYTAPGAELVGTYRPGEMKANGVLVAEPGVFYPGLLYSETIALGSHLEKVYEDYSVEMGILEDGEVTITKDEQNNYTIVGEFTTPLGYTIDVNWTGVLTAHNAESNQ